VGSAGTAPQDLPTSTTRDALSDTSGVTISVRGITERERMVQQLKNLDKLVGKQFLFVALPIKIRAGSGCPIRAVALEL